MGGIIQLRELTGFIKLEVIKAELNSGTVCTPFIFTENTPVNNSIVHVYFMPYNVYPLW